MELCDFSWIFKDFLRMFLRIFCDVFEHGRVWYCDIFLISSESTDYEFFTDMFMELLYFWCEVLTIVLGCMRMFDDALGS